MNRKTIVVMTCVLSLMFLTSWGMTADGIQFKNLAGLETGSPSSASFAWQTPETVTLSNATYFVRNCMTSGASRISFDLHSSSNEPVAYCRVSIFADPTDSENAMFDSLVFCITMPINAYAHCFRGVRNPSGDVSIWKYAVPTNIVDESFVFRTFGNINMMVNTYTNNTAITAETVSEVLKTQCANEVVD